MSKIVYTEHWECNQCGVPCNLKIQYTAEAEGVDRETPFTNVGDMCPSNISDPDWILQGVDDSRQLSLDFIRRNTEKRSKYEGTKTTEEIQLQDKLDRIRKVRSDLEK